MIKVGISGIGFMGWIHFLAYQRLPGVEVVAICSRDPQKRAGDWSSIAGNFGPPAGKIDLSGITVYSTIEQMLADPRVDLVDICLPTDRHLSAIQLAANAGKHVFCEKPLALSVAQCDTAIAACQRSGVRLFIGHVLPYFVEYQYLLEMVAQNRFGKLLGGHFRRVVANPTWQPDYYDLTKVGGPLLDLHVHDAHLIRMLFGMPRSAHSIGRKRGQTVSYCQTNFCFAESSLCVSATSGVIDHPGRPFNHGYEVHFENATLQFEFAGFADSPELMPLKTILADGTIQRPALSDGDPVLAFQREIAEVIECLETSQESKILNAQLARDAIQICQIQAANF